MNLLQEKVRRYSVYEIENVNKKSKNYRRKIFVATSYMNKDNILSRIRTMQDSKTGRGGSKELSKDLRTAGKNYEEEFEVREVATNLTRERAEEVKAQQIEKYSKVYNEFMHVP